MFAARLKDAVRLDAISDSPARQYILIEFAVFYLHGVHDGRRQPQDGLPYSVKVSVGVKETAIPMVHRIVAIDACQSLEGPRPAILNLHDGP
jgi:hypothetical protein